MKKFCKKIIALVLILSFALGIAPMNVFAGGGGGSSTPSIDRTDKVLDWYYDPCEAGYVGRSGNFPGPINCFTDNERYKYYTLAISLGRLDGATIDTIIVSYYTPDSKYPYRQVLEVNRGVGASDIEDEFGSKEYTLLDLFKEDVEGHHSVQYYTEGDVIKNGYHKFTEYETVAQYAVPDLDTSSFPNALEKARSSNCMRANGTEYISFRAAYDVERLESISFLCTKTDDEALSGEIGIENWALYETPMDNRMKLSNYAFVSNALGVSFNGTCRYKSTEVSDKKLIEGITVAPNGMITYYIKDDLYEFGFDNQTEEFTSNRLHYSSSQYERSIKVEHTFLETEAEYLNENPTKKYWEDSAVELDMFGGAYISADSYKSDIMGGDMQLLCCEKVNNPETIDSDDINSITALNFEIKLADEYGAGIERFNIAATQDVDYDWSVKTLPDEDQLDTSSSTELNSEQFNALYGKNPLNLSDVLTATITYIDKNNSRHKVSVPIISNAILSAFVDEREENMSESALFQDLYELKSGRFVEYAQQGTRIAFGMDFPAFKSLESMSLSYLDPVSGSDAQIGIESIAVYSNTMKKLSDGRVAPVINAPSRDYYIKNFDEGTIDVTVSKASPDTATLNVNSIVDPELMFVSNNTSTVWIANETKDYQVKFDDLRGLAESQKNIPHPDGNYDGKYLVSIKTDNMAAASTCADVLVQFTYKATDGKEKETMEYNIREVCSNYEGYVDGMFTEKNLTYDPAQLQTDVQADVAYYYGMQSGNTIHFIMTLREVVEFTGAKFKLDNSYDEWQLSDITITDLSSMSERILNPFNDTLYFTSAFDDGLLSFSINHDYRRIVNGREMCHLEKRLLVQKGDGSTIDFETGNAEGEGELRPDMDDYDKDHRLPQYMAESDLKFTTSVKNYEVIVHVGKNSQYASGDDSCGSNNMYYFQLQFADGATSAYVLANRQLASDGFRSGADESFIITSNKDHGDVTGITIIPDDISSNCDPLDKLCIDSIDVIKKNTNTPDKKFVAENVGWISTAYRDTSEQNDKEGRTEFEMAINIPIAYSAYMMNLEIAMSIGAYPSGMDQYVGDMTCDLYYETSSGETKCYRNIQVVKLLYEYKNRTAPNGNNGINYMSDAKTMFRENHTDRFIVAVEDCTRVTRIVFHGNPVATTKLNIKSVDIYALRSKGVLLLSELDGDYVRSYNEGSEPILVAELESHPQRACSFIQASDSTASFYLASNEFPKFDDNTVIDSDIARVPASSKDTINMYLYLSEGTPIPSNVNGVTGKSDTQIEAGFVYNSTDYSKTAQVSTTEFNYKKIDGQDVIYKEGMTASNMSVINYVWASSKNDITSLYKVDHAVLQQVRNGVVIDTMVAKMDGIFTKKGGTTSKTISSMKTSDTTQIVTLQLTEGTIAQTLDPEREDIAVSIIYRTNSIGSDKDSLTSPIVFATDNGTTSIKEGSILTFEFKEYDVKEIVGLRVQAVGDVTAHVGGPNNGGAIIECNEFVNTISLSGKSSTKQLRTKWFSTDGCNTTLTARTAPFTVVSESSPTTMLRRVDITFKTRSQNNIIDSAGSVPIRATIQYNTPSFNSVKSVTITDIRPYISSENGSFGDGGSVTTSFMLPGFIKIVSIEIEPYDFSENNMATWNLDSISIRAYGVDDTEEHTIKVDYEEAFDSNGNPINYISEGNPMRFFLYGAKEQ